MQAFRVLLVMTLAPPVASFGSFVVSKQPVASLGLCISAQQHVEDAHSIWMVVPRLMWPVDIDSSVPRLGAASWSN